MGIEIAKYQFHSWSRKGIASNITQTDNLGTDTDAVKERAKIVLPVALNEAPVNRNIDLVGPGDIIGVNRDMIVRTQPLNYVTGFEPNYLAFAEFYDEDFLWRYTPAAAAGEKLRPWIFLLLLKEDEFERTTRRTPLPSIMIKNKDAFPPATETWLWAHVHSDIDIPEADLTNYETFLISLNSSLKTDPDQLYCRLMSPRKLEADTFYHAFVIPAFETGRLAGTEQKADQTPAQAASWDANGAKGEMPVYFEWYFRTGTNEDFESLVKRLKPRKMDSRVGIRDMDCSDPGFVKADGTAPFPGTSPSLLGLEGALKSPDTVSTVFPLPANEKQFQTELQKIVNLPFEITGADPSGDPIVSVPLYGGNHAKKNLNDLPKLDITKDSWLHELNKDPRTRVPAGFGTRVVQNNQEGFMRKAWAQIQKILDANRRIKSVQLCMNVALKFTEATFSKVQTGVLIAMSKPVLGRIVSNPVTILQQIRDSRLPSAALSGSFRKITAPSRRISKLAPAEKKIKYDKLVADLSDGSLTASPSKIIPLGSPNVSALAGKITNNPDAAEELKDPVKQLQSISAVPGRPAFKLQLSDEPQAPPANTAADGNDNAEAEKYRQALTEMTKRLAVKAPEKPVAELNISDVYAKLKDGINPRKTFPRRLSWLVKFPEYIKINEPEKIFPAMAYPDIEDPMYKKLTDISDELLLPNVGLIPANTISLLVTNPAFIESYMVGLNHEMGRELLWREYPTDQRGSYFRQFWDTSGIVAPDSGSNGPQQAELLKDIRPIHLWETESKLGEHNNRNLQAATQLVLIIRGDLLKKYPHTVIFAQKAVPGDGPYHTMIEKELSDDDFKKKVKFPVFGAEISPDIKFFGFDLTVEQAYGTDPTGDPQDSLGWYFVIMQAPGSPTFGMDINFDQGSDGLSWDDLAWDQLPAETRFIQETVKPAMDPEEIKWGTDAAGMAYILFQKPNMVAVHAKQMLENLTLNHS